MTICELNLTDISLFDIQSSISLTDDHNLGSESEEYNDRCKRAKKMKRTVPRNTDREFDSEDARVGN